MKLTMQEIVELGRLMKAAQSIDYDPTAGDMPVNQRKKPNKGKLHAMMRAAYPNYGKSLVSQRRRDPQTAGIERGIGTGITGAVLGALIASVLSKKPGHIAAGAVGGGLLAGVPGYISGKAEAESDYTKLLALRRLGIQSPAEYDQAMIFPDLAKRITTGRRI